MITLHPCNVSLAWASYSWPQLVTVGRWGGAQWTLRNKMTDSLAFYGYMCGTNFLRVLLFAIFPATLSNLNSLDKNTVLRNRVCSITTFLFLSETKRYTMNLLVLHRVRTPSYCLKICISIICTYSIKMNILSVLGTGYFLKISRINSPQ